MDRDSRYGSGSATRRDVLKLAGAGGLAAAIGGFGARSNATARYSVSRQEPPEDASYDVVIVGGGVSGVYAGWRLLEDDPSRRVAVCEMSDRIGGRLFSVTPPGAPHLRAELGGMRLLNSQKHVVRLAEHLGLILVPFPLGDTRNLLYLRGHRWTQGDWGDPELVPYVLQPDERGKSPNDLMQEVIYRYVPDADDFSAADWRQFKETATVEINGQERALYETGFWELLLATVSSEAYDLIRDAGGYHGYVGNWNAAEALEQFYSDYVGATYQTLREGFQALPLELAERFEAAGGDLLQPYALRTVQPAGDGVSGAVDATFLRGEDPAPWRCRAEHLVLAMPPRSIELLDDDMFLLADQQFRADLDSVLEVNAAKTFLVYAEPWWEEELGLQSGRSVTGLPIRQTYYFGSEGHQPGADPANQTSLLMASYADGLPVEFWRGYTGGPPFTATAPAGIPPENIASLALATEVARQVAEVHGPEVSIPAADLALYADWSLDPYGGAYQLWRTGVKSWEIIPRMRRPDPVVNVSVCGTTWSNTTFVEGALASVEHMLQDELGLGRPGWLPPDVDLGP